MLFDLDLKVIIRNLLEGLIRIPNKTKKKFKLRFDSYLI